MGVSVKENKVIYSIFGYLLLCAFLIVRSCGVSMQEPFTAVTIDALWWQLIFPAGVIGSMVVATPFMIWALWGRRKKALTIAILVVCIFLLVAATLNIHGYLWDLVTHASIPER